MRRSIILKSCIVLAGVAAVGGVVVLGWYARPASFTIIQPSSEDLAGWQTYQNPIYGYQVKFPQDFTARIQSDTFQYIQHKSKRSNMVEISVVLEKSSDNDYQPVHPVDMQSFISFVNKHSNQLVYDERHQSYSRQHTKLNDYDAIVIHDKEWDNGNKIYIYYNQLVFLISYTAFDEYKPIVDKILSTFTFVR